jgi:hypothetical protein
MIDFKQIIENDDLDTFKIHFKIENWKDAITQIKNYASVDPSMAKYIKEVSYDNADCFKYALHCNADKIFNYLLPLVDTDKHGDNYGWPLLAMAVKKQRYDYAHAIVNHPNFDPYPRYHSNMFMYIDSHPNTKAHIELLFDYLNKFDKWAFRIGSMTYEFTHLICYNEETFNRFEKVYREKLGQDDASVLDLYTEKMDLLADEIFNHKYNEFMLNKLTNENITTILECALKKDTFFVQLFESPNAKAGLMHLLKSPEALNNIFDVNPILLSYLPLDCILLMIDNGVDIWKETENKYSKDSTINALDFILDNDNIEEEKTAYFIDKYPQEIFDRWESKGMKTNIQKACQQKLLQQELPENNSKIKRNKI